MIYCPNCGSEVDESANFCPNCGHELNTIEESESESLEEQPNDIEGQEGNENDFKSEELTKKGAKFAKKLRNKGVIGSDEVVLHYAQQKRSESMIKPAKLILSERQLVYYKPGTFSSKIESRDLDKIDDISVDSGLTKANMTVRSRGLDNLEFDGFPKDKLQKIRNAIRRTTK